MRLFDLPRSVGHIPRCIINYLGCVIYLWLYKIALRHANSYQCYVRHVSVDIAVYFPRHIFRQGEEAIITLLSISNWANKKQFG